MNDNVQIISKGLYRGAIDKAFPVEVKEYILTRKKGKRYLLLRFYNNSPLNVTAISFWLTQRNSFGEQLSRTKVALEGLYCGANAYYAPSSGFLMQDGCVEFEIDMISVFSGDYEYKAENGEGFVRYAVETTKAASPQNRKLFVQRRKLNRKVTFTSIILVLAIILILLAFFRPFFVEDVFPAIKQAIKNAFEALAERMEGARAESIPMTTEMV